MEGCSDYLWLMILSTAVHDGAGVHGIVVDSSAIILDNGLQCFTQELCVPLMVWVPTPVHCGCDGNVSTIGSSCLSW